MWTDHSVTYDLRAHEPIGSLWGFPLLIPTCLRKLFAQGVRLKYVDVMSGTLRASSSDLITWNTPAMISCGMTGLLKTAMSMAAWDERDLLSPFRQASRRGYARIPPVSTSSDVQHVTTHISALFPDLLSHDDPYPALHASAHPQSRT